MKFSHYLSRLFSHLSLKSVLTTMACIACSATLALAADDGTNWATDDFIVSTDSGIAYGLSLDSSDVIYEDIGGTISGTSTVTAAYGAYLNGATVYGSMTGEAISASGKAATHALYLTSNASIGESGAGDVISSDISATSSANAAYGVYLLSGSNIYADVTGDITVNAYGASYGVYLNASSSYSKIYGDIGTDSSTISSTSTNNAAYGINMNTYAGVTGDVKGSIDVTAKTSAYGIFLSGIYTSLGSASADTVISADITVSGGSYAAGILLNYGSIYSDFTGSIDASGDGIVYGGYLVGYSSSKLSTFDGDIAGSSIEATSSAGDAYGLNLGKITLTGDISTDSIVATSGTSAAYGVYLGDYTSVGDISSDISATGVTAVGLYIAESATVGTISGNISATTTSDDAANASAITVAVSEGETRTLTFDALVDTTLSAQTSSGVTAAAITVVGGGELILSTVTTATEVIIERSSTYSPQPTDETYSSSGTITITGDIVSDGAVSFVSGDYMITGESITATELNIYSSSSVSLSSENLSIANESGESISINIYIESMDDLDSIIFSIDEGSDVSGISGITVYFSEEISDASLSSTDYLGIIDDQTAAALSGDAVIITYSSADGSTSTVVDVEYLTSDTIPEPSTVTLGLLALTALLARRRRRQA